MQFLQLFEFLHLFFENGDFESILKVTKGHSAIVDKHVCFAKKVGKGYFIMLGTIPEEKELLRIIEKCAAISGAERHLTDGNVLVTKRVKNDDVIYIAATVCGNDGELTLSGKYTDILSGREFSQRITLSPFEVLLLKKQF